MQNALLTYQTITCNHAWRFKAVGWLRYDSAFHRSAAFDHTKPWDAVDQDLFDYFFKSQPPAFPVAMVAMNKATFMQAVHTEHLSV